MKKLNEDQIRDIAIRVTDRLVELGFVPNCIDSDDETEFSPIKSEREKAIEEMMAVWVSTKGSSNLATFLGALYDAGYRKVKE